MLDTGTTPNLTGSARIATLSTAFDETRRASMRLRQPLSDEDCQAQSMPEASPAKWHLAHTTWFFEQFILARFRPGYRPHHPQFGYLFNSYYNAMGPRHARPRRGLLTRPQMAEVEQYRMTIDEQTLQLLASPERRLSPPRRDELHALVELGIHHEQQHQELLLTDIKHLFSCNPLQPVYTSALSATSPTEAALLRWLPFDEGIRWIGHHGDDFAYDNESPRHRVFLDSFEIASRPVTTREYLDFIEDGGYSQPHLWLDEGWTMAQREQWQAPLYWDQRDGQWWHFTLAGPRPLSPAEPVCHISFFEADAFARWAGARLPREQEWETACIAFGGRGTFAEHSRFHPAALPNGDDQQAMHQALGDVWEWTASPYIGYPGYRAAPGAIGEYNGKFMCNQWVLRGGSCATPRSHIRPTYRNFFNAAARWQFSGLRLARDVR